MGETEHNGQTRETHVRTKIMLQSKIQILIFSPYIFKSLFKLILINSSVMGYWYFNYIKTNK